MSRASDNVELHARTEELLRQAEMRQQTVARLLAESYATLRRAQDYLAWARDLLEHARRVEDALAATREALHP